MTSYTFEHIHLRSPDPEATAVWYERMFGAKVIRSVVQGAPRVDLDLCGATVFIAPVNEAKTAAAPKGRATESAVSSRRDVTGESPKSGKRVTTRRPLAAMGWGTASFRPRA